MSSAGESRPCIGRDVRSTARASVVETACPLDCPDACSLCGHGAARQGGQDRRLAQESRDRRIHLREGAQVRRARLRPGSAPVSRRPQGPQGRGPVQARVVGRSARARSPTECSSAKARGRRRVDPALFLRRLERPAHAGQPRRAAVAALRHVAARAHGVRRADRRGEHGALRQDAVGHLPGLSGGEADRPVGREPVGVRHPPDPVRARGAEARREARRHRSARRRRSRASADVHLAGQARHRRRRSRSRSTGISSRTATPTRRFSASTRTGAERLRERAEPWTIEQAADVAGVEPSALRAGGGALRDELAGARPLRLGTRTEPQRRQRRDGRAGAAGRRRQVRRARRRLLDEQLGVVEHRPDLDRRAGTGHAHRQHESPRAGAHRVHRSAGQRAVRLQLQPGGDRARPAAASFAASSARISSRWSSSR